VRVDGSGCDDGDVCTTNDACGGGVCAGVGDQVPDEVDTGVQVSLEDGIATITWNAAPGSSWSAVLRRSCQRAWGGTGPGTTRCAWTTASGGVRDRAEGRPRRRRAENLPGAGRTKCGRGSYLRGPGRVLPRCCAIWNVPLGHTGSSTRRWLPFDVPFSLRVGGGLAAVVARLISPSRLN
jgi:hypothetical protein